MPTVQLAFRAVGLAALGLVAGAVIIGQDLPAVSQSERTKQNSGATLKVIPAGGMEGKALTLRFTVPAHARVFKIVGLGKDVNLAADAVASAKYLYKGRPGAVKVDVDLINETTLDVLPEVEQKP